MTITATRSHEDNRPNHMCISFHSVLGFAQLSVRALDI